MKEKSIKKLSDHKHYPPHHLHVLKQMAKPHSGQSTESKSGLVVPGSALPVILGKIILDSQLVLVRLFVKNQYEYQP